MPTSADPPPEPAAPVDRPLELPAQLPAEVSGMAVSDEVFDRYAHLVRVTLDVPVALVSLVTADGQLFAGAEGLPQPWQETRRTGLSHSFCQHVVAHDAPLVVADAREDPRLADNLAIPDIGVVAYAGYPLHAADGSAVGSLCAIDTSPRTWSEHELDVLAHLAATVSSELALRAAARRVEQAVRAEAMWDLTTRAAGIGTYVLHLPGRELEVDDKLLELSGLTRETFSGHPEDVYTRVHPEDLPDVVASVESAAATGSTVDVEYRIVLDEGEHRWVAARGRVLSDVDGAAVALVGAVHDVTAAREATARIAQVTESMAVGYLAMDAGWRITYANAQAVHALGLPREELVGGVVWELFPATVGTEFEDGYRRAAETGKPVTFDAHYPAPLDAWYEVRATPEAGGVALYFVDITARRRAQEAAERAGAQLAALGAIALSLADAEQVGDLVATIAERGLPALGADGGSVAVPDPEDDQQLLSYISAGFGEDTRAAFGRVPLSAELPVALAARSGQRVLLGDHAACAAMSEHVLAANEATGCQAWASVPLRARGRVIGVLTAGWAEAQVFSPEQLDLLETYAAQCAQALQRLQARDAERAATERQAGLVSTARALADADTEEDVLAVVATRGGALVPSSAWGLTLLTSDGRPCVHDPHGVTGLQVSTSVPLQARGTLLGSLVVASPHERTWSTAEQDLLEALAGLTAQALSRIAAHDAERTALAAASSIAETLQRSMLTAPPEPDHLQIAVRYAASADHAEVGGDWYDAFITPEGVTTLVIGDVTGHDMRAAAVMGQLRNLVRGVAFTTGDAPAAVVAAVDRASVGLGVDTVATAVVAQVEQDAAHRAAGTRLLRWSNAGHLPPLLVGADGTPRYLEAPSDLVLGLDPATPRHDHEVVLEPGSTLLLYTDGLVERRRVSVERGLAWLAEAAAELADGSLEELCDGLVELVGDHLDDDVALLALRAYGDDGPRPAEAGPEQVPAGLEVARRAAAADGAH